MEGFDYKLNELCSGNIIWSDKPAPEWAESYPVGNGRIGGMVFGRIQNERIALNHDLLWRQFWAYQKHRTAEDIKKIRDYCLNGQWDEADETILSKIPSSGRAVYINPYVPVGDMYIDMFHEKVDGNCYIRILDMDTGIVQVKYSVDDVIYKREVFCSWEHGIMLTHLSSNRAGVLSGEVSLSRLCDPECIVTGYSEPGKVIMRGEFEEGRKFAAAAKVIQRGGRLTGGKKEYRHPLERMPEKDFGLAYRFSRNEMYEDRHGASTCFDSSDEVLILLAVSVDEEVEKGADLEEKCMEKLNRIKDDYYALREKHIEIYQPVYRRVIFSLDKERTDLPTDRLLEKSIQENTVLPELLEKIFNLSRYLAISSGRPQPEGEPCKAPINLQGIWNQDRRPAWDSDYHLDLNLEMCYWPLDMLNLGELIGPLMAWAERISDDGRTAAMDLYGCSGVVFPGVCDYRNIGNIDTVGFCWTGAAAWISQILWQHWEYSCDMEFLKEHLYPFIVEVGRFYEDFLFENDKGCLLPSLSSSPEMPISGRKRVSFSSTPSTIDLELIRDVFKHLTQAGKLLGVDPATIEKWGSIFEKVPLPEICEDGSLCEWLEEHIPADPGHRHRSHLVGICPGDRISMESTPDYTEAVYKALKKRHQHGKNMTQSLTFVWDAQILARLYRGEEAYDQLKNMLPVHVLDNLLIACNDWRGDKGGLAWFEGIKLFQIEANIAIASAIVEMIFQDRQGCLKFLPALPLKLPKGKVEGLKARGGFEVDIEWEGGRLVFVRLKSFKGNPCSFENSEKLTRVKIVCENSEVLFYICNDGKIIKFDTIEGKEYFLFFQHQ